MFLVLGSAGRKSWACLSMQFKPAGPSEWLLDMYRNFWPRNAEGPPTLLDTLGENFLRLHLLATGNLQLPPTRLPAPIVPSQILQSWACLFNGGKTCILRSADSKQKQWPGQQPTGPGPSLPPERRRSGKVRSFETAREPKKVQKGNAKRGQAASAAHEHGRNGKISKKKAKQQEHWPKTMQRTLPPPWDPRACPFCGLKPIILIQWAI